MQRFEKIFYVKNNTHANMSIKDLKAWIFSDFFDLGYYEKIGVGRDNENLIFKGFYRITMGYLPK